MSEPSDHLVWLVCPSMYGRDGKSCRRCPSWEEDPRHGKCKRGCRLAAEEVVNIVQTGNPWRKPAAKMVGTKWEDEGRLERAAEAAALPCSELQRSGAEAPSCQEDGKLLT